MAVTLKEGHPVRGMEAIAERPDGTRVPFLPYPTPLRDATGQLVGAINLLVDLTERRRAEVESAQLAAIVPRRMMRSSARPWKAASPLGTKVQVASSDGRRAK